MGIALACLLVSPAALAQTVSVQPCMAAAPDASAETEDIVLGCLDGLFTSGLIATNADTQSLDPASWETDETGLRDARLGFVDYELAFYVVWAPSKVDSKRLFPLSIAYRVVDVGKSETLARGSIALPGDGTDSGKQKTNVYHSIGALLATACSGALDKARQASGGGL